MRYQHASTDRDLILAQKLSVLVADAVVVALAVRLQVNETGEFAAGTTQRDTPDMRDEGAEAAETLAAQVLTGPCPANFSQHHPCLSALVRARQSSAS